MADKVDLDQLTERLSLQDWRASRGDMYRVIDELRGLRAGLALAAPLTDGSLPTAEDVVPARA